MTDKFEGFDPQTKALLIEVQLGLDAEQFLASQIGKAVVRRAQLIGHEAVAAIKEVDPHDAKKIMELQNMIRWADAFPDFIRDMVQIGRNAEEQIKLGDINE